MEKIFEALHTPDAEKVNLATFMLKDDAEYRWRSAKQLMTANHVAITWESFKRAFMEKYFPETVGEDMENQILSLRQVMMTVGQYAARLETLSKHFRFFQVQVDEAYLCNRFMRGLRNDIEESVRPLGIIFFHQLVEKAHEVETMKNRQRGKYESGGPIRSGQRQTGRGGAAIPKEDVVCFKCNQKGHYANECGKEIVCWKCQKPGHVERNCPNAAKAEPVLNTAIGRRPSAPGRVFAISWEQAAVTDDLIQGTCTIAGNFLMVLFDSGATHSFIAEEYVKRLGLLTADLPFDLYHILLDCANKAVVFPDSGVTNYLNSYTLRKGSPAFVNSIVAEAKNDGDVRNILIVHDYVDVFP
ncbi:uncharacterized protein LOC130712534 [Lotus japonicus]|uniref:uncharacterized protein LOC130712534 n=1 Tax=Lotus japonicus TaxID=34305 RepID=UPI00258FEA7C|nr:uncharacterized protein LOC130712534 [Lotus japonicus]